MSIYGCYIGIRVCGICVGLGDWHVCKGVVLVQENGIGLMVWYRQQGDVVMVMFFLLSSVHDMS